MTQFPTYNPAPAAGPASTMTLAQQQSALLTKQEAREKAREDRAREREERLLEGAHRWRVHQPPSPPKVVGSQLPGMAGEGEAFAKYRDYMGSGPSMNKEVIEYLGLADGTKPTSPPAVEFPPVMESAEGLELSPEESAIEAGAASVEARQGLADIV